MNKYNSNHYLISFNTFSNCDSVIFDLHNFTYNTVYYSPANEFNYVNYVELNIDKNVSIDVRQFFNLDEYAANNNIGGININLTPGDDRKTLFENQIGNLTYQGFDLFTTENLMSLSFNSTNDWINSGFRKTLSSWGNGIFGIYYKNSKLNIQGSISTSTGKITNLKDNYFQPKFSPNYNSLKHYMVLYGDSYRDYFEIDPHALEAGHNNNACENILLQQDYTFYSTLTTEASKDNYTFIQWPSTEITFSKSNYSNNTLLNTISDITKYFNNYDKLNYKFADNNTTYTQASYRLYTTLASKLGNTSSSSQLYAGFSYSGLLTSTASTSSYIQH
jgi:hypothetical protein